MFYPELDEKESVGWPLVKQLFQAPFLLWELVIDLPDVHWLQIGVAVARIGLADMHKQVLVELEKQKCISGNERIQKWQMFHLLNASVGCYLTSVIRSQPLHLIAFIVISHHLSQGSHPFSFHLQHSWSSNVLCVFFEFISWSFFSCSHTCIVQCSFQLPDLLLISTFAIK